jgi:hypothetical protein
LTKDRPHQLFIFDHQNIRLAHSVFGYSTSPASGLSRMPFRAPSKSFEQPFGFVLASTIFPYFRMRLHKPFTSIILAVALCVVSGGAQQTNPVDRAVSNPITDTPNINPVGQQPEIKISNRSQKSDSKIEGGDDEVVVYSDNESVEGEDGKRIITRPLRNLPYSGR